MRVLGIDPGIARTGWGIIDGIQSSKFRVQNYGCLETSSKKKTHERLVEIYNHILKLIQKYSPDEMAIEELFFNTNSKTAFVVGQARGVVILAGAQKKLSIGIYTPLQVKIAVSGYGRAEKAQVGKMVKTILGLKEIPTPDDTTDALAVGLAHLFSRKINKL
ncbi:MAG: crossover junction endodeoxyribonuclease RuvC [Patescibacteria group bacterium]